MRPAIAILALLLFSSESMSAQTDARRLIMEWDAANGHCRGLSDVKVAKWFCRVRDDLDRQLEAAGWCFAYYRDDHTQTGVWRPCYR